MLRSEEEQVELVKTAKAFSVNGQVVQREATVPNGATISIIEKESSKWIYQDVFRFSGGSFLRHLRVIYDFKEWAAFFI